MRATIRTACNTALVLTLVIFASLIAGCNGPDKEITPPSPQVVTPKTQETVEMMPPNSEEFLRRHFIDSTGFEVETHINYRNGEKAIVKMRPDKTKAEYRRMAKNGTVRIEQIFAADGKTVIGGHELRDDLTKKFSISQNSAGATTTVTYWYDGVRVFSEKTVSKNGAYEITYYYKSGKKWLSRSGPSDGVVTKEAQYRRDGTKEITREPGTNETIVTRHRADGTAEYRQHIVERPSPYGGYYTNRTVISVEEMDVDGTTVLRKLVMSDDGYSLVETVRFNADGTTTHRTVTGYYGTVTHEETRDSNGTVTSQKDYTSADNVQETYDSSSTRDYYYTPDPTSTWDMQERYPQYRNQD